VAEKTNIQLCGRLIIRLDGRRVEDELPGAQGRMLFGFLALNRSRFVSREQLVEAVWDGRPPAAPETALRALLSKSRGALGANRLEGKADIRLMLPATASIDVETAAEATHDADSAVSQGRWRRAWVASHIAVNIARRPFLAGLEARWIDERRRQMDELHERGLETLAAAGLGIGGPELDLAERAARSLVSAAPFRESGHRLLVEILAAKGNIAESILVYESLRQLLREELGTAPSAELQDLHAELLRRSTAPG
jgi:DNA-binding SARP family transcriptional activator